MTRIEGILWQIERLCAKLYPQPMWQFIGGPGLLEALCLVGGWGRTAFIFLPHRFLAFCRLRGSLFCTFEIPKRSQSPNYRLFVDVANKSQINNSRQQRSVHTWGTKIADLILCVAIPKIEPFQDLFMIRSKGSESREDMRNVTGRIIWLCKPEKSDEWGPSCRKWRL